MKAPLYGKGQRFRSATGRTFKIVRIDLEEVLEEPIYHLRDNIGNSDLIRNESEISELLESDWDYFWMNRRFIAWDDQEVEILDIELLPYSDYPMYIGESGGKVVVMREDELNQAVDNGEWKEIA